MQGKTPNTWLVSGSTSQRDLTKTLIEAGYHFSKEEVLEMHELLCARAPMQPGIPVGMAVEWHDKMRTHKKVPFVTIVQSTIRMAQENGTTSYHAFVKMRKNGHPVESQQVRSHNSEIDAYVRAVQRALEVQIELIRVQVHTEGVGANAVAHAVVTVLHNDTPHEASAEDSSQTRAVIRAYIEAINDCFGTESQRYKTLPNPFLSASP